MKGCFMKKRIKHPDKEIEETIQYAESKGWVFKDAGKSSHAWCRLLCPLHTREGHKMSIWTTPRSSYNHAQQIYRQENHCEHEKEEDL